jgi:hypothetical protein
MLGKFYPQPPLIIFNPITGSLNLFHFPNTNMLLSLFKQILAEHLFSRTVLDPGDKVLALGELRKGRCVGMEGGGQGDS